MDYKVDILREADAFMSDLTVLDGKDYLDDIKTENSLTEIEGKVGFLTEYRF